MNEFNPEEAAQAQSQPGVFSFIERLQGRGFPKSQVKVYLDEVNAFERNRLAEKAQREKDPKVAKALEEQIAALDAVIAKSRYIVELHGFAPERYDEIIDEVYEEFPAEHEVNVNPFSGAREKAEIPNEERTDLLYAKLWAESIRRVIDAQGNEDNTQLDVGTAAHLRNNFPIDGRRKIDTRIQELRMGGMWMDAIQDEGFLATP